MQNVLMIEREYYLEKILWLLNHYPVVALVGSRQVGKTTLAKAVTKYYSQTSFYDLENPAHLAQLADPMLALQHLKDLVVIDEIQHQPNLFKTLRVLADRPERPCKFLVLGSASPSLLRQSAESLAGRIAYQEIKGFSLQEIKTENRDRLWLRGGFPRSFLAPSEAASVSWRQEFIRTFLERDLPQLGIQIPAITMRRFWMMLAHYHGQLWNASEFARAFGMGDKTVRHYLDILSSTFVINQLPPWWENISKRQVKAPKVYLSDSGLLHVLLGLNTQEELEGHPKIGASWEGFAINTVMTQLHIQPEEAFFWRTYSGAELDLFIIKGNQRLGFEFKRTVAPQLTRSLLIAAEDLKLSQAYIIHAGENSYPLATNVTALSLVQILSEFKFNNVE